MILKDRYSVEKTRIGLDGKSVDFFERATAGRSQEALAECLTGLYII